MAALLLLASALPHLGPASGYFLSEDFGWIRLAFLLGQDGVLEALRRLFLTDAASLVWREPTIHYPPLAIATLMLDLSLWGPNPVGFHATSLAMHLLASALLYRLARSLYPALSRAPLAALALFALSPLAIEPVAWISARRHLLAGLFALMALLAFDRWRRGGRAPWLFAALCATSAGMVSQETALAVPALVLLRDQLGRGTHWTTRRAAGHVALWGLLALYVAVRLTVVGGLPAAAPLPLVAPPEEGVAQAGRLALELRDLGRAIVEGGRPLAAPRLARVAIVLSAAAAVALAVCRRRWPVAARLGLAWAFVAMLPLLPPLTFGPRHFYLASMGLALGLPALWQLAGAPVDWTRIAVLAAFAVELTLLPLAVAAYDRAGRQGWQLRDELLAGAALLREDPRARLVVLPEALDPRAEVWVWQYATPHALAPPFAADFPLVQVLSTQDAYCCWGWPETVEPLRIDPATGPIYLVAWDAARAAYATRRIDRDPAGLAPLEVRPLGG